MGTPLDQLHDEVGPAGFCGAGVVHLGNVRVVHHGQGLTLGLEAGDHLLGVHAQLDDLQGDRPLDRVLLLGQIDGAEPTLAEQLEELVAADDRAGSFSVPAVFVRSD